MEKKMQRCSKCGGKLRPASLARAAPASSGAEPPAFFLRHFASRVQNVLALSIGDGADAAGLRGKIATMRSEWRRYWNSDAAREWRQKQGSAEADGLAEYNSVVEEIFDVSLKPVPEIDTDKLVQNIKTLEQVLETKLSKTSGRRSASIIENEETWAYLHTNLQALALLLVVALSTFMGIGIGIKILDGGVGRLERKILSLKSNIARNIQQTIESLQTFVEKIKEDDKTITKEDEILKRITEMAGKETGQWDIAKSNKYVGTLDVKSSTGNKEILFGFVLDSAQRGGLTIYFIEGTSRTANKIKTNDIETQILKQIAMKEFPRTDFETGDNLENWKYAKFYECSFLKENLKKISQPYQQYIKPSSSLADSKNDRTVDSQAVGRQSVSSNKKISFNGYL